MIHPAHIDALDGFFAAYGHRPAWVDRHQTMIDKCQALVDFWRQWQPTAERTRHRHEQLAVTIGWTE